MALIDWIHKASTVCPLHGLPTYSNVIEGALGQRRRGEDVECVRHYRSSCWSLVDPPGPPNGTSVFGPSRLTGPPVLWLTEYAHTAVDTFQLSKVISIRHRVSPCFLKRRVFGSLIRIVQLINGSPPAPVTDLQK